MFRLLDLLHKLFLLDTSLALDAPIGQNLLELLDSKLGNVLHFHFLSLDWILDGANLWIALVDALANFQTRHTKAEWLCHIALDGINVVAYLLLFAIECVFAAISSKCCFNFRLLVLRFLWQGGANIVHDLDAYCVGSADKKIDLDDQAKDNNSPMARC